MAENDNYLKGRGAQLNTHSPYESNEYGNFWPEGIDEEALSNSKTQLLKEHPKKIVNRVDSPDLPMQYSMNPYQGCEHGCIYCYARNTHQYWGLSAGLDFERKIMVKENAAALLAKQLSHPYWKVSPIMLSGNTDCYQPVERKLKITREMLKVLLDFRHPVRLITKNDLILRDMDVLKALHRRQLVNVSISITTLNERLRQQLEPRTTTGIKRLQLVKVLANEGIPVNVMIAPLIPSLNSIELPEIMKAASEHGATSAAYTIVRLNGAVETLFRDWLQKNYPDRAEKVLHQIAECRGGKTNDSRYGTRMRGDGNFAAALNSLFLISQKKYFKNKRLPPLNHTAFYQRKNPQLRLL
jgi:DNA repair photolyase